MKTKKIILSIVFGLLTLIAVGQVSQSFKKNQQKTNKKIERREVHLEDSQGSDSEQQGILGFSCSVNTLGYTIASPECGKIEVSFSTNETYEQVRVEWRESFTTNWSHRTFNGFSGNRDFTIPGLDPLKEYDIRMKARRKDLCLWKLVGTSWHKRVKAVACKKIQFTINDNSKNYCKPLTLNVGTLLGQNYSSTTLKMSVLRSDNSVAQIVQETWPSYPAPPQTFNLEAWARSKNMIMISSNAVRYKVEVIGDDHTYVGSTQVFTLKRTRECVQINTTTPVEHQQSQLRTRFE